MSDKRNIGTNGSDRLQKSIPRGKLLRGSIVGTTAAKVGVMKTAHLGRRAFVSEKRRKDIDRANELEIAKVIYEALSRLRGTALKAAQLLSMEIEWVPETYRRELAKASSLDFGDYSTKSAERI